MLRTRTSRWTVGTAALCLLLLGAAWLLLISPRRSETAELASRNLTAQQQNQQLQTRIEQLKAQSGQLATYRAELAGVTKQLPAVADMPQLVRDLNTLAAASGVTVDTLTPSSASAMSTTGTKAGTPAAAPTAKPSGVVQIPIALVVHGDYFQAVAFLQKLQTQLTRAFLVSSVQVAQNSSGGSGTIQLSLTGSIFAWPAGAQVTATAATSTATATAVPAPTSTAATTAVPAPTSTAATTGGAP